MKLGMSSYSLKKAMDAGNMSIVDVIGWVAEQGAEHIELVEAAMDLPGRPELVRDIRRKAEESGLPISNYLVKANFVQPDSAGVEKEVSRVLRQVEVAAALGVRLMRHDVASRPVKDATLSQFIADLPLLADACGRIADYAGQFGITTTVENHGYYMQGSDRVMALIREVGRDNFRMTVDVGNFIMLDEDALIAVKKNLTAASMIHLKDFYVRPADNDPGEGWARTAGGRYRRGAIVGHGDLDIRGMLKAIKASGYDGCISIEFEGMEDCLSGSRIGLDNVRRYWNEV